LPEVGAWDNGETAQLDGLEIDGIEEAHGVEATGSKKAAASAARKTGSSRGTSALLRDDARDDARFKLAFEALSIGAVCSSPEWAGPRAASSRLPSGAHGLPIPRA